MLQENTYVVSDATKECVVIDCGALYDEERAAIVSYIRKEGLTPVHLISTHGHFDHNLGNGIIFEAFGLKPEVPVEDEGLMDLKKQMKDMLGTCLPIEEPPLGRLLSEGDTINFGHHTLTIIHTPGHTPGGVTFYCEAEHTAFTGDTLFQMSIGRTDFEGGSWTDMVNSLKRLAMLPAQTVVYAGHGEATTISEELKYNPYMR